MVIVVLFMFGCTQKAVEDKKSDVADAVSFNIDVGVQHKAGEAVGYGISGYLKDNEGNVLPFQNQDVQIQLKITDKGSIVYEDSLTAQSFFELDSIKVAFSDMVIPAGSSKKFDTEMIVTLPNNQKFTDRFEGSKLPS